MRIIHPDQHDSGVVGPVDENLVEDFRNGNFSTVHVEEDFLRHTVRVIDLNRAMSACVHVQRDVAVRRQPSTPVLDCSPLRKSKAFIDKFILVA